MFANVVRARVLQEGSDGNREVAIKIVRCQESMSVQFRKLRLSIAADIQ